MLRYRLSAIAAAVAVLVGCVSSTPSPKVSAAPPTAPQTSARPGPALTDLGACAGTSGFTCGKLRVPLDHTGRVPGTLDLAVAMADSATTPRGVLLVLSGGPGQPGVSLVNRIRNYLDPAVLREYRMVMLDQRGTGPAGINCADLQTATGGSDFLTPPAEAVDACAAQLGATRDFYGTPDTVRDIELLRLALKAPQLSLDGVSYGTFSGANYALAYPSRVRSLVLDSVVPFNGFDPFGTGEMAAARRILADACRTDPSCTTDPVADLAWLVRNGEIDGRPIDGPEFIEALAVLSLSFVNPSLKGVAQLLHDARNGDTARLKELFQQASSLGTPYDQLSAGLHLATFCSDLRFPWGTSAAPLAGRQAALNEAVSRLRPEDLYPYDVTTARSLLAIQGCLRWPPSRPSSYPKLQRLVVPTLIVHGDHDLFCPVEWAHWEYQHAERAKLVIVRGGGHSSQSNRTDFTARNAVRDFLLR
ncbi:MAG TPA: alpha/beta hydrolase [Kribbellaceae bacterium]|nr:alpha/beta hydrolase [Kribbellaceae bacterium]